MAVNALQPGSGPDAIEAQGAAPGAPAEGFMDAGPQASAPIGADAGQEPAAGEGQGAVAGGERSGERRGRRRGRRGRRGGGPREGAVGGAAAFTPNDAEGTADDYSGDETESNEPIEGAAQGPNGHAGNGATFPVSEPLRSEPRGGASISWTGMALPEAAPAAESQRAPEPQGATEPPVAIEATAAEAELEPSAIDTAKLPKLEAPVEDAPVVADPAAEPSTAPIEHAAPLAPAAADQGGPIEASAPATAPAIDPAPAAAPSRVVWSSGPAPRGPDRGRED
jgi:hypothetical protein